MRTFLWAHPRSRSTAFERAFIERGDCVVLHEPFSKVFYHGAEEGPLISAVSDSAQFQKSPLLADVRYVPPAPAHELVKDMPAHANYPDAFLRSFSHHVLLVRKPAASIRSFFKVNSKFDAAEAGYFEMLQLANRLKQIDAPFVVVEADEFAAAPEQVMTAVCRFLGVVFEEKMVRWDTRTEIPAWEMWTEFHKTALTTTTISPKADATAPAEVKDAVALPEPYLELIKELEPVYHDILNSGTRASARDRLKKISHESG